MDSTQQADGERRVRELLLEPLLRRGLARPSSLTRAEFEEMNRDLCSRLAYMTPQNLMALEEQAASHPGGKDQDRFPIANRMLEWAAQIQPPGDDASPLIRAVFAHALGAQAIAEGWAPELLRDLRRNRRWPTAWTIKTLREKAEEAVRQLHSLETRLARGERLTEAEAGWRHHRLAQLDRCVQISELGKEVARA